MNSAMATSHMVIPVPDPLIACGSALNGGYTVQPPPAGPVSRKNEMNITTLDKKKNQYDNMFMKPDAMSRAPTCNGIKKLEKVPLKPAVNTKNTMMVPCMVTR